MEPVIDSRNNIVFVNVLKYKLFKTVKPGDIVVAENPFKPGYTIVKRVVYTENQMAEFFHPKTAEHIKVKIPENHVWLEGDNKISSKDSREFGPISMNLILGFVTYRLWPYHKIMKLE